MIYSPEKHLKIKKTNEPFIDREKVKTQIKRVYK